MPPISDIVGHKGKEEGDDGNDDGRQFYLFLAHLVGSAFLRSFPFLYSKGINEEGDGIGNDGRLISKDIINSTGQNGINNTKVISPFA
ncbi:Uncharacterised protein [Streptococcus pneumoniae]|nr:Uncharacterised protein [Streptococcus pneumoniae]VKI36240.1 Uncharacterised protein [Streptococcus pneumoniae]VMJ75558.1 Uncharacterised protein [Streptococcus pneumoniae]VMP76757.1 Uncharacterised protein [Streptococcus pneumoniae]VNL57750.1 Uncharacterised protein [Streptococcus pneumoniae]